MKLRGTVRAASGILGVVLLGAACAQQRRPEVGTPHVETATPEAAFARPEPSPLEPVQAGSERDVVVPLTKATPAVPSATPLAIPAVAVSPPAPSTPTSAPTRTSAPAAGSGAPSLVVSRGRTDRRAVALTFDAGADRGHAERILDELRRERVTAAFGVTGAWADANRDLVARVNREGHALINHSYDHPSFTGASWSVVSKTRTARTEQLARTERAFADAGGGTAQPYFRPPFGDLDAGVLADVGGAGYAVTVMWTVDSMGWRGWDAPRITARCLEAAVPGAIYIFHVGAESKDADALGAVIEGIRARGFEIAPLADVIDAPAS